MNMQDLIHVFGIAKEKNMDVCIELTIPGREEHEFIIVVNSNLDYKLDYCKSNYSSELILNRCNDIKIINSYPILWMR